MSQCSGCGMKSSSPLRHMIWRPWCSILITALSRGSKLYANNTGSCASCATISHQAAKKPFFSFPESCGLTGGVARCDSCVFLILPSFLACSQLRALISPRRFRGCFIPRLSTDVPSMFSGTSDGSTSAFRKEETERVYLSWEEGAWCRCLPK